MLPLLWLSTLNKLNPNKPICKMLKMSQKVFFLVSNRLTSYKSTVSSWRKVSHRVFCSRVRFAGLFMLMKSPWGDPVGLKRRAAPVHCHWYSLPAAQTFPTWRDVQYAIAYVYGDDPSCRSLCRTLSRCVSSHLSVWRSATSAAPCAWTFSYKSTICIFNISYYLT